MGPAVIVSGTTVRVWSSQLGFDPGGEPSAAPDQTFTVPAARIDALFDAWRKVPLASLPHSTPSSDCYAVVAVRTCAACKADTLRYSNALALSPEMGDVWKWFDDGFPKSVAAAHPTLYCRF